MGQMVFSRTEILSEMNKIAKTCGIGIQEVQKAEKLKEEIAVMYRTVYGVTYPPGDECFQTGILTKRQVICHSNCIRMVFRKRYAEAFWELYDFVEDGNEELLNHGEMLFLMTALRFFKEVLEEEM